MYENFKRLLNELNEIYSDLHVHYEFSNLRLRDSINKIPEALKYTSKLGRTALAITDHESLSGHMKFLNCVADLKTSGDITQDFKPILGDEIYLVDEQEMWTHVQDKEVNPTFYHFILLAKDKHGHEQLRKLSSLAWERMFFYKGMERVPTFYSDIEKVVGDNKGHLIASSACLGSYIAKNIINIINAENEEDVKKYKQNIHRFIRWCEDVFGKEDFYIELQPATSEEQVLYNQYVLNIAKAYGLEWIITTDAHYLEKKDAPVHEAFLTADDDDNESGNKREVASFYESTHFFDVKDMFSQMQYLEKEDIVKGITNTKKVADKIEIYDLDNKQIIPKIVLPDENEWYKNESLYTLAKQYQHINQMINSEEIYDRYLISQCLKGLQEQIPPTEYQECLERMDIECEEIIGASIAKKEPLSSYFITMQKNIDIIWEEALVMPGRGSAGAYVIDYLLEITQVHPLKQGIEMPHWRFISASRPDYPDIDIDIPSHKRAPIFNRISDYYQSIGGNVVRVCTFGTETAKSAVQTACRGLGINNDEAQFMSSLIPVERGKVWSIHDCYYGNENKNRNPQTEFKNAVDEYSDFNLLEVALGIEGLINKRSSHPCGVLILNEDVTKYNAVMRAPSGELITQFNLEDSEQAGNLKYDFLNTKTCSMIQVTLEMLIEDKVIEWQGNLRKTYKKYLHPDAIDEKSPELWQLLNKGKLISAFQYDSIVGNQALKAIQPTCKLEAVDGNNLMRLMVEGVEGEVIEQPMDRYVRYKSDINEWYQDMKDFGLNQKEIDILRKHLDKNYGVCSTQEGMMMLSMDKEIAQFNVVESNLLRKGVAKKKGKQYEAAHTLLYEKGLQNNVSKKLLDYVWDVQIAMQKGYGFSVIHGIEYTWILIQQLNLIYYYPSIYWNTAVLIVESGSLDQTNNEEDKNKKEKSTNYGKVAKAIGDMQGNGVKIALPDINNAKVGFSPNVNQDEIIYGLKGIMKINNEDSKLIMQSRPFKSVQDFSKRLVEVKRAVVGSTGKVQNKSLIDESKLVMLIKAGAFDEIEGKPRYQILEEYLYLKNPPKKSIDARAIQKVIEMGIVPPEYKNEVRFYRFLQFLKINKKMQDENAKSIQWYTLNNGNPKVNEYSHDFFNEYFITELNENRDYRYNEDGDVLVALGTIRKGSFMNIYNQKIQRFLTWLKGEDCLNIYNKLLFDKVKEKNMKGNISSWEMESMNFYYHEHELCNIDTEKYNISNYNELSEEPKIVGYSNYKNKQYPRYELSRIAGTVLDRNKTKHSVTLLTPHGVVLVKFYSGQFGFYDKIISKSTGELNAQGKPKKIKLEDGWFKRGTKLIITGYRRGDQFKAKRYSNTIYRHSVEKIESINENGEVVIQGDRIKIEE